MFTINDFIQVFIYLLVLSVLAPFMGSAFYKVLTAEKHFLTPIFGWLEKLIYKGLGKQATETMDWKKYLFALLSFNIVGILVVLAIQLLQGYLPLNPQNLNGVEPILAFNTAVSFVTNTNWQSYAGEVTLSYFTQMFGLTVQNFLSASTGIAVLLVLARGFRNKQSSNLGNFWQDITKSTLYILLPLSILFAVVLAGEGVVQTFNGYQSISTLSSGEQTVPLGPAASQIAIKQLGTNGGGFFNTNSAFPLENPTPFSNFLQMLALLLIPAALVFTFGKIVGSNRQAWMIYSVMMSLLIIGLVVSTASEYSNNPILNYSGSMEGKETRFGVINSLIWSSATTAASNGSINAMHSSLSPLAGMVALFNMMLGEIVFGGVGSGLYGMLLFVLLTVFISGLMVGRSPEYLGKKIEGIEIKLTYIGILLPSAMVIIFSAIAVSSDSGLSSLLSKGPHGFSEIVYAFTSAANNNGSAFAGLNANTPFYNSLLAIAMLVGRFGVIIPVVIIAGELSKKKSTPESAGTLKTDTALFAFLLFAVILIVGGLTFFPMLALGPLLEHLLMNIGLTF